MKLLTQNLLNTTTMLVVGSNTVSAQYLFDRREDLSYDSSGFANDLTSTIISIVFSSATVIDKLFLQSHNLRQFRIFYNSLTANVLSPDANVSSNSETSHYFNFASVTVSSIQLQMDKTIAANAEKSVGEFFVGRSKLEFERNPAGNNFDPIVYRKQIQHEMPDGGIVLYNVADKKRYSLKFEYLTESFRNSLRNVYDDESALYFIPFPTTTAWDGEASEVVWTGNFDFNGYSANNKDAGFGGKLALKETS